MKEKTTGIILIIILIAGIWIWSNHNRIVELENENAYLSDMLMEYQTTLDEANANIEELDSIIEDAQGYAWSTYEEMGETLDNLYTLGTIPEP